MQTKNLPVLLVFCSFLFVSKAQSASETPTITVRGTCLKQVTPDRGSVTLTAKVKDKDAGSAVQKVTEIYNKLFDKSKNLKLKDAEFESVNYSVNEEIDWSTNKRQSMGFTARMGLEVSTTEIKRLGEVMKLGSELKIEESGGLNLFVSDTKMKDAYESCLEDATKNARQKAESIAKGANAKLGKIVSIREEGVMPAQPPVMPMAKMMRGDMVSATESAPAEIATKDSKIQVHVDASFSIQ